MENAITQKRSLFFILVIVTIVTFIGMVWLIATYVPWDTWGLSSPTPTESPSRVIRNCTYPLAYWLAHPELYPAQIVLGSNVYPSNEIDDVLAGDGEELAGQLKAQLAGAFLNTLMGADQSKIDGTIFRAYGWTVKHAEGSDISDLERQEGSMLASELETYNQGLSGVAQCQDAPTPALSYTITPTWSPTVTTTLTATSTPSPTGTPTPSSTPSPTGQFVTPFPTVFQPTRTVRPTTEVPGGPSPTQEPPPTNTQMPAPTDTRPAPSLTLPPLPTATNTLPPPP